MNIESLLKRNLASESSSQLLQVGYFVWQTEYPNRVEWQEHDLTKADTENGWMSLKAFIKDERFI